MKNFDISKVHGLLCHVFKLSSVRARLQRPMCTLILRLRLEDILCGKRRKEVNSWPACLADVDEG